MLGLYVRAEVSAGSGSDRVDDVPAGERLVRKEHELVGFGVRLTFAVLDSSNFCLRARSPRERGTPNKSAVATAL